MGFNACNVYRKSTINYKMLLSSSLYCSSTYTRDHVFTKIIHTHNSTKPYHRARNRCSTELCIRIEHVLQGSMWRRFGKAIRRPYRYLTTSRKDGLLWAHVLTTLGRCVVTSTDGPEVHIVVRLHNNYQLRDPPSNGLPNIQPWYIKTPNYAPTSKTKIDRWNAMCGRSEHDRLKNIRAEFACKAAPARR